MNQEQPTAAGSIESRGQGCCAGLLWEAATLILNLPDHPIGREDAANTELLGGVLSVAMAYGIDQSFMQSQLNPLTGENTIDWLGQQLQQRSQLQGRRQGELSPANLLDGTVGPVDVGLSNLPLMGSPVRICGPQVPDDSTGNP